MYVCRVLSFFCLHLQYTHVCPHVSLSLHLSSLEGVVRHTLSRLFHSFFVLVFWAELLAKRRATHLNRRPHQKCSKSKGRVAGKGRKGRDEGRVGLGLAAKRAAGRSSAEQPLAVVLVFWYFLFCMPAAAHTCRTLPSSGTTFHLSGCVASRRRCVSTRETTRPHWRTYRLPQRLSFEGSSKRYIGCVLSPS